MSSIQQDVNSALGQMGILAALSPELQAKAKEKEALGKIEKREGALKKQFDITKGDFIKEAAAQGMAELSEIRAANGKPKELRAPEEHAENYGRVLKRAQDMAAKGVQLAQEKFDIAPSDENYGQLKTAQMLSEFFAKEQAGKPITEEGKKALEAIQRAQGQAATKKANQARRTKLLYGEMERMMPGFKYMEPKKQNKIIKDLGPDERKRIKDEAERREKYYGK